MRQKWNCLLFSAFLISGEEEEILSATLQRFQCNKCSPFPLPLSWLFKCKPELLSFTVLVSLPDSKLLDGAHLCRFSTLLCQEVRVAVEASSRDPGTRNALE